MDNGTQMTSNAVSDGCRFSPTGIVFIDPGSPWQNPAGESFTGRLRDEPLAVQIFHTVLEAKVMAENYRQQYNVHRPHSSLGYLTPDEFALQWHHNNPGLAKSLWGAGQCG
jgi:putative transposase